MAPGLNFERTSRLVARSLGVPVQELVDSFRPAEPADLDEILALRETVFGHKPSWDDRRYLQWRYALAPGSKSYATFRVLRLGGKIIAGIGAEEFLLDTPAGRTEAACAMDILALEHYWGAGIGALLNLALFRHYPVVLALSSNSNSTTLVKSLYAPLEPRSELQFPLDVRDYIQRRLRIPGVAAIAGPIATVLLRLRSSWYRWRAHWTSGHLREITGFTSNMHLTRLHPNTGEHTEVVRNPDYLNWRYFNNPRARYRVLGWFDDANLCSYVVFGAGNGEAGTPSTCIVDWWLKDEHDLGPFRALVAAVVQVAIDSGSSVVRASASGKSLQRQLYAVGFSREVASAVAAGWHNRDKESLAIQPRPDTWCFTGLGEDMDT